METIMFFLIEVILFVLIRKIVKDFITLSYDIQPYVKSNQDVPIDLLKNARHLLLSFLASFAGMVIIAVAYFMS